MGNKEVINMPKVIQVIESFEKRGLGVAPYDPVRRIRQYHTVDGEFLAEEFDQWVKR